MRVECVTNACRRKDEFPKPNDGGWAVDFPPLRVESERTPID